MQNLKLTKSQLSLWASQKLHPNVPLHNVAHTYEIYGAIDVEVFKSAFKKLLKGSDILQTVFSEQNGIPYQSFEDSMQFELDFVDFTSKGHISSSEDWVSERVKTPFDISKRNFDTALLRVTDNSYIWFFNLHHLITDGATTTLLYNRMNMLYIALLCGNSEITNEIPTYKDYVVFESEEQQNIANEVNRTFWQEKLLGLDEQPRLYGASNNNKSTQAERYTVPLGAELSGRLKELAKHRAIRGWTEDSTLFNIFSTIFFIYLYRIGGQKKMAVGVPIHNRTNKKFRATAGLFMEVFPFINELSESDTFYSVYQKLKREINVFLKNAKPGVFDIEMAGSSNVMLNYIMTRLGSFNGFPVKSEWIFTGHMNGAHQIELHIVDFDKKDEIELLFDINTNVLNGASRENMPNHFLKLLDAFIENMEQLIYGPSIVPIGELKNVLCIANKTADNFVPIVNEFENQVRKIPENEAIIYKHFTLTYKELNNKVNEFAHYLKSQGMGQGSRAAILLKRSPEYVISVLSVLKTGAAFVPIPPNYPEERIQYMLEDSKAGLLIGSIETLDQNTFANISSVAIDSSDFSLNNLPKSNLSLNISQDDTAFLIYTSGSTGKPKGVKISHGSLTNYIKWTEQTYIDIIFPAIPFFTSVGFDITANSVFLPFICGGSLHIYPETDFHSDLAVLDVIKDNRVDFIKLTPAHLSFVKGKNCAESRIKVMVVTGDEFKTSLAQNIYSAFGGNTRIYNEYGPAEATIGCIYHEFTPDIKSSSVPIGLPITNMEVYVLDDFKNPVPRGVIGEIYLAGTGLADGYWEKPELTAEKFVQNPFSSGTKMYRTQDLGRINENGIIEFLGRRDFQVKINGHRIELGEIEAQLSHFKSINESVVLVDERNGLKNLAGYFVSNEPVRLTDLQSYLSKKLPRFMIPMYFKQLEEFPLSPNGKIDRKALRLIDTTEVNSKVDFIAPQTEIEEILAEIWKEVLGVSKIGIKEDFIALGGNSLAAIRITSRINEEIEMNFTITKVFELPTIEAYSDFIEDTLTKLLEE